MVLSVAMGCLSTPVVGRVVALAPDIDQLLGGRLVEPELAGFLALGLVLQPSSTCVSEPRNKAATDGCLAWVPPVR